MTVRSASTRTAGLVTGHDEYLFQVVKDYLPEEALYMIRYHSFYAAHRERAYDHLMNDHDQTLFQWVRAFNPYDLYTKSQARPDVAALRPFHQLAVDVALSHSSIRPACAAYPRRPGAQHPCATDTAAGK